MVQVGRSVVIFSACLICMDDIICVDISSRAQPHYMTPRSNCFCAMDCCPFIQTAFKQMPMFDFMLNLMSNRTILGNVRESTNIEQINKYIFVRTDKLDSFGGLPSSGKRV